MQRQLVFFFCVLFTVAIAQGDLAGATTHCQQALKIDPNFEAAQGMLTQLLAAQGK